MSDLDRYQYGYDLDSNRLYKANVVGTAAVSSGLDEFYAYDPLNRLTKMQRGVLNGTKTGITGTPAKEQDWTLDATGNWSGYLTKTSGTTDLTQTRTANPVNEITAIGGTPAWATPPAYDPAGNMTSFPQPANPSSSFTATYDAWNRMTSISASGSTVATYQYDGRNRRTVKVTAATSETRHFYYTNTWQDIEERVGTATTMDQQYVWGIRYVDELVCRDDATATPARRLYATQDANFNLTAITDTSGAVVERYVYEPYGTRAIYSPTWATRSASSYAWNVGHQSLFYDRESGLLCARLRYSHPQLGLFLIRDLAGYNSGANLSEYLLSRPIMLTDPFGLDPDLSDLNAGGISFGASTTPDPSCCNGMPYDPSQQCCENNQIVSKQSVYVINRSGGKRTGLTEGHIDMYLPGSGLIGYYGSANGGAFNQVGMGLTGHLNMGLSDWLNGPTRRPQYVQGAAGGALSTICQVVVCPSQVASMNAAANAMQANPGTFNMVGGNCATHAASILGAGGVMQNGISGIDNPQHLQDQLTTGYNANCVTGYTQLDKMGNLSITQTGGAPPGSPVAGVGDGSTNY